jgi:hypothetical protein
MPSTTPRTRLLRPWLITAAAVVLYAAPARADQLDERLLADLPQVFNYLKEHKYQTVGIVKFSVTKGSHAPSMNAGALNTKLALKLEHLLIAANDPAHPLTVLHDVTSEAARSRGLGLSSAKGRRGLLEHAYPLAWGDETRRPDVLLTGDLQLSADLKSAAVVVKALDPKRPDHLDEVHRISGLHVDRDMLAGVGQSFLLSRGKLRSARDLDDAASEDAKDHAKKGDSPADSPDDPVALEIRYGDQVVTLEDDPATPGDVKEHRKTAKEQATQGKPVQFKLTNKTQDKVGVVLAINGKNTLFQEDLAEKKPGECSKWILGAGETYTIDGFYTSQDGKNVLPFKVLSDEESAKAELAPEHKGVYSLFVFKEGSGGGDLNVELGRRVKQKSHSAAEAREKYQRALHVKEVNGRLVRDTTPHKEAPPQHAQRGKDGRGLVVAGEEATAGSHLKELQVKFDPEPMMALFIRYYTPTTPDGGSDKDKP